MPYFTYQNHNCFYREQGQKQPGSPLILILHGNTASSALHENELAFFSSLGYHAAAFDFLGCGQSDRLESAWPLDWWQQNAAAAVALLDHLGYAQVIPVGCSGGAVTALWMALDYPERVWAVIADSENHTYPPGFLTEEALSRQARTPGQVGFWADGHGPDWESVVDADSDFLRRLDEAHPEGVPLFGNRLNEIRCPVMFSVSLTDSLLFQPGPQTLDMAAQVAGSWMFAVNAGDHPLMWSCPQAWQAAARSFLGML